MPDIPIPPAPAGLDDAAATFWREYHEEAAEDDLVLDVRERKVLALACEHMVVAARTAADVADLEELTITVGAAVRVHPLVSALDTQKRTISTLLASIKPAPDRVAQGSRAVSTRYQR